MKTLHIAAKAKWQTDKLEGNRISAKTKGKCRSIACWTVEVVCWKQRIRFTAGNFRYNLESRIYKGEGQVVVMSETT